MKASAYSNLYSLGIMTGTSCDGADLALLKCKINSNHKIKESLIHSKSYSMNNNLRVRLRNAQKGSISITDSALLTRDFSQWLSQCIESFFKTKKISALKKQTLLSVHGQTIWHEPKERISIQLIDPSILAVQTGCSVAYQFRQADLARQGQGAPLVPLYHLIKAQEYFKASDFPLSIHNIGGISNFTYLDPKKTTCFGFDTGPGNCLIDLSVEKLTKQKKSFDENGSLAGKNLKSIELKKLKTILKHPYFSKKPPKSTGRELFNEKFLEKFKFSHQSLIANVTAFTALTMAYAYRDYILKSKKKLRLKKIFFCGGGSKNPVLLMLFEIYLKSLVKDKVEIQILPQELAPSQFVEAMAFARLGVEGLLERKTALAKVTGALSDSTEISIFTGKNFKSLLKSTLK